MNPYRIEGDFQMGRVRQHFVMEMAGANEAAAKSAVLAAMGSRHGVNRRQVWISKVTPLKPADVTDPAVKAKLPK